MKLLILLFSISCTSALSQQYIVTNTRQNIVYCGVDNSLLAMVGGYSCKSVVLTTDNGKIEKDGCGGFNYRPLIVGETTINTWIKVGKKLKKIGTWKFLCKRLPMPVAFIGPSNGGNISLKQFIGQGGVRISLIDSDFEIYFQVNNYTLSAIRNNQSLFIKENTGAQYNTDVLKYLQDLQTGDHLLISNIKTIGPDNLERTLAPLEFIITD